MLGPGVTVTASDFTVRLGQALEQGRSRTFTLRVGLADTALTCTISGSEDRCTAPGTTVVPPGALLAVRTTSGPNAPLPGIALYSFGMSPLP